MNLLKVIKFEIKSILRSRWIFGYTLITMLMTAGLVYLTNDTSKVLVSLILILPLFVPLVSLIFSTLHWYYNERFTVLLLTQPISRKTVLFSRYLSLSFSLSVSLLIGVLTPFIIRLQFPSGLTFILIISILLNFIFVGMALWISTLIVDRLKGIGLVFGSWIYFSLIHDGLLLIILIMFKESPLDGVAGIISSLSPISLSRVVGLMYFDQALLLGHTGALVKQILTSWKGVSLAAIATVLWLFVPLFGTYFSFRRRDF